METKKYKETPETKKFMVGLRKNGFKVRKNSDRFKGGVLDILALREGITFYIEVKVNKNTMSALQTKEAEEIAAKKGLSFCLTIRQGTNGEKEFLLERVYEEGRRVPNSFSKLDLLIYYLKKNPWN